MNYGTGLLADAIRTALAEPGQRAYWAGAEGDYHIGVERVPDGFDWLVGVNACKDAEWCGRLAAYCLLGLGMGPAEELPPSGGYRLWRRSCSPMEVREIEAVAGTGA